jgi:crotonobetainyl-CoA:carnitine CoA-transferase CaiB-like acyl-CoA transferase
MTGPFGALQGLKVVDLTQMLAGPYCTQLLADHGAEVIKIESPEGDMTRPAGPFRPEDEGRAFGGYYCSINRNKRSLVVDLKRDEGRAIVLSLAAKADIVVENYRAGVMERLGLAYETLAALNPRLVYASIRGFGDPRTAASPYVDWPAFDVVAQAMGGMMGVTGPDRDHPTKIGPGVGDTVPALFAAFGILAAVIRARETGQGQYVDVGMVDSVLALSERIVYQHSITGAAPGPEGNHHPMISPFGLFPAADGHVALACQQDAFWKILCEALDLDEMAADPRFADFRARVKNRKALESALAARTATLTKAELARRLGGKVPFGPVLDAAEIAADPHFAAREMVVPVLHPGHRAPIALAGVPVRMSGTPGGIRRRAPWHGEDTEAVLREAGFDEARIAAWRAAGVVRQHEEQT